MSGQCLLAILLMAMVSLPGAASAAAPEPVVEIRMAVSADGGQPYFDPVGIHLRPGKTVRWVQVNNYHSVAAYHPANGNRELRIPVGASPWNSDVLLGQYPGQGSTFEWTFEREGVYDYYCDPHEAAGMAGRIVVGRPGQGPGTQPLGYGRREGRRPVPEAVRQVLPAAMAIVTAGKIRHPAAVRAETSTVAAPVALPHRQHGITDR